MFKEVKGAQWVWGQRSGEWGLRLERRRKSGLSKIFQDGCNLSKGLWGAVKGIYARLRQLGSHFEKIIRMLCGEKKRVDGNSSCSHSGEAEMAAWAQVGAVKMENGEWIHKVI